MLMGVAAAGMHSRFDHRLMKSGSGQFRRGQFCRDLSSSGIFGLRITSFALPANEQALQNNFRGGTVKGK
jgi:hypothetical protein